MSDLAGSEGLPVWLVAAMSVTVALGGQQAFSGIFDWIKSRRGEGRADRAADISEVETLKARHALELAEADARIEAERRRANEMQERHDVAQTQIDAWRMKYRELEDLASAYKHLARRKGAQDHEMPVANPAGHVDQQAIDAGEAKFDGR